MRSEPGDFKAQVLGYCDNFTQNSVSQLAGLFITSFLSLMFHSLINFIWNCCCLTLLDHQANLVLRAQQTLNPSGNKAAFVLVWGISLYIAYPSAWRAVCPLPDLTGIGDFLEMPNSALLKGYFFKVTWLIYTDIKDEQHNRLTFCLHCSDKSCQRSGLPSSWQAFMNQKGE